MNIFNFDWLNNIARLFLVSRVAALFKLVGASLATAGVTVSSQDNFQSASEKIVGILFVIIAHGVTELSQKQMVVVALNTPVPTPPATLTTPVNESTRRSS